MKKKTILCARTLMLMFTINTSAQGVHFEEKPLAELLSMAQTEGKLVFVDCYTTWCAPCKKMAAEVFEALKKQEGTVKCGDIYGKYHFDHCDGCNLCAIQKVIEVLYNNGDIQTSTAQPWASAATPLQDR